jgi:uncharacterized membrane protein required for colicin V production
MGWVDIGIVAVLLGCAILGYRRGLMHQVVNLLGLVAGVLLALYLTGGLVGNYAKPLADYRITYPIVFLAIVGVSLLVSQVIGRITGEVMEVTFFGWFDNVGGAIAGFARGTLWVGILITIAFHLQIGGRVDTQLRKSSLAGPLSKMLPAAFAVVKSYAHDAPLREPFRVDAGGGTAPKHSSKNAPSKNAPPKSPS